MTRRMRTAATAAAVAALLAAPATSTARAESPVVPPPLTALDVFYGHDLSQFQWALDAVGARAAHAAGYLGEGVKVAVVDTGVDGTHPDLLGRVLPGVDTSMMGGLEAEPVPIEAGVNSDDDGHGTHVAGIIAAANDGRGITGIAPRAQIIPVKVLSGGFGSTEGISAGIRWAATSGADVINLSLGMATELENLNDTEPICAAVKEATDAGVSVVVSAGNDGVFGNYLSQPAGCPGVISVSSFSQDSRYSWFSSYDGTVSVAGPGMDVLSTVPTTYAPSGYWVLSGTSMAAPAVAGVAALVAGTGKDRDGVYAAVTGSARDAGRPGRDALYGYGLVSASGAVGAAQGGTPVVQRPYLQGLTRPIAKQPVLSWSLPGDAETQSWEIRSWPDGKVLGTAAGTAVRGSFDASQLSATGGLQVAGLLRDGSEITSPPYYLGDPGGGDTPTAGGSLVTAAWEDRGLRLNVVHNEQQGPITVVIEQTISPGVDSYSREVTLSEGTTTRLLKFGPNDQARGLPLMLSQDLGSIMYGSEIPPQRAVHVEAKRINRDQVQITGHVWCYETLALAPFVCIGRPISIVDRTGRVLARTSTAEGTSSYAAAYAYAPAFSVVITTKAKSVRAYFGKHSSILAKVAPHRSGYY